MTHVEQDDGDGTIERRGIDYPAGVFVRLVNGVEVERRDPTDEERADFPPRVAPETVTVEVDPAVLASLRDRLAKTTGTTASVVRELLDALDPTAN